MTTYNDYAVRTFRLLQNFHERVDAGEFEQLSAFHIFNGQYGCIVCGFEPGSMSWFYAL